MIRHAFTGRASSIIVGGALSAAVVCGGMGFSKEALAERQARAGTRTSVNHDVNANRNVNANVNRNVNVNQNVNANVNRNVNANQNVNANVNRNVNVNQNVNANVNRNVNANVNQNVNVNRNVNVNASGGSTYHPVATAAAVTTAAVITGAVIGSMVNTLPPSCTATIVNGVTYQNCGGAWYQPQYAGSQVTYVVVNAPK
jgi:hypothetical protein